METLLKILKDEVLNLTREVFGHRWLFVTQKIPSLINHSKISVIMTNHKQISKLKNSIFL